MLGGGDRTGGVSLAGGGVHVPQGQICHRRRSESEKGVCQGEGGG